MKEGSRVKRMEHKHYGFRAYFILAVLLTTLFLLWTRLYYLQVANYDEYKYKADRQYAYTSEFYDRGNIFFSYKDGKTISLASIRSGYKLAINPALTNKDDAQKLFSLLESINKAPDESLFWQKVYKKDDPYEEVASNINSEEADKIRGLEIKGVILSPYRWRYYPFDSLGAQTIGFVAYLNGKLQGAYGLERFYEDVLSRDTQTLSVNFFAELFGEMKNIFKSGFFPESGSLITSIEPQVQMELEKVITQTKEKWNSKRVSAIVYDPNNGEVIAMASTPSFNLNEFYKNNPALFRNPLVENVYEMGSIVKPVTVASALDAGAIKEGNTYKDTGFATYNGRTISNYDNKARGVVPVQEILSQSLNVGAAWVYTQMGKQTFKEYFAKFGLLEDTGIDLPNEASNIISNINSPRDIELVTASFGQGVAFTPVTMVRALGALATGKLQTPHLVRGVLLESGLIKYKDYSEFEQVVLDEKTVETISRMLTEVVDSSLDDGRRKKERFAVAAKTGTAQIPDPSGGYFADKYNHTFFGYFPAFNPRFVILLINEEPNGAKYASQTLTEPFYRMLDFMLNYYNIEPDR